MPTAVSAFAVLAPIHINNVRIYDLNWIKEVTLGINKKTSCTLQIANLIAMILVIAIHYNSRNSIDISERDGWNYICQEFLANGIARIAVPFFAMLSGLFILNKINGLDGYIKILKNKSMTLLVPYVMASTAIFIVVNILKVIFKPESYQPVTFLSVLSGILVHPSSCQFWFLRDLIILTILSPILLKLSKPYAYFLLLTAGTLWALDAQLFPVIGGWYLLNIETLFFFCFGGAVIGKNSLLVTIIDAGLPIKMATFILWVTLIALRIYIDPDLDVWYVRNYSIESLLLYKLAIIVGIIFLIQSSSFLSRNNFLIYISGLTFFAYLFHIEPLVYFKELTRKVVSAPYLFYVNFPIATIVVFLSAHLASKYLPNVYAFISGGRTPNKALKRTQ